MIKLFEYQKMALSVIEKVLKIKNRALVIMATGLGKTIVVAFWSKKRIQKKQKGLFLCHDKGILDQSIMEFRKVLGPIASLKPFYGVDKDWDADKADVVFATFQTLRSTNPFFSNEFDFIIVDESHHGQAPTYKNVIDYFEPKKIIGITALPDREDEKDIRDIFGEEIVNYSLEESIAKGWLTPIEYQIITDNFSRWSLKKLVRDIDEGRKVSMKQLNETIFIDARDDEIAKIILKNADVNKKTIIFCENILHAENFKKFLPRSDCYHSKKGTSRNRRVLNDFREGNIQFILTINKFNEGIDVPDAELIVFLRCTDSKTVFFQQLGRGLRKKIGKEKVLILDFVANCERLVTIKEVLEGIKRINGSMFDLNKDVLHISGESFNFIFGEEQVDILELIERIKPKMISDIPILLQDYSIKNLLPPDQVRAGTNEKLIWECHKCGNEWRDRGNNRLLGRNCKICKGGNQLIVITHPDIAEEYSNENPWDIKTITKGSRKNAIWICKKCGHKYKDEVRTRVNSKRERCKVCAGPVPLSLLPAYSKKNIVPVFEVDMWKPHVWICNCCKEEFMDRIPSLEDRIEKVLCPDCKEKK